MEEGRKVAGGERNAVQGVEERVKNVQEGLRKRGMRYGRCRWKITWKERRKQGVREEKERCTKMSKSSLSTEE